MGGRGEEGFEAVEEPASGVLVQPGHRCCDELAIEHVGVGAQSLQAGACEPDKGATAVVGIGFALEQAVALELGDDLADHRLGTVEVPGGIADRHRSGLGKVLQHGT